VIFNKRVQELQEELAKDFNRLTLYIPKTLPVKQENKEQKPRLLTQPVSASTGEDPGQIVGKTAEEVQGVPRGSCVRGECGNHGFYPAPLPVPGKRYNALFQE